MADTKSKIKEQIKGLEDQKKQTETLYFKLQGAVEALEALIPTLEEETDKVKKVKK
tara:strand:- start:319 stop:486 length:168 start_codon:yes stop_codon:yes gene_type:complete